MFIRTNKITYRHDPVYQLDQHHQALRYNKKMSRKYCFITELTEDLVDREYHHDQVHHEDQVNYDHLNFA
jgi:hypothetical protein